MTLSLRQSLLTGFGIVLGLFLVTSVYVNYETRKIHTIEKRLLDTRLPTVLTGEKLLDGIHLSLAGLRAYLLLGGEPAKADKFKAERAAGWQKIDLMMADYKQLSKKWEENDNQQRLEEIQRLIETFRQVQQEVEDIAHTPENIDSINILLTQAAPQAKKVVTAITAMINAEANLPATPERKAALKLMADSRGSFALGLASIRAYLLSGDQAFKASFDSRWATNEERFKQLSQQSFLFAGAQKTAWDNYSRARSEFAPLPPQMFASRGKNDWNKANYWLGTKAAPAASKINTLLASLATSQEALTATDTEMLYAEEVRLEVLGGAISVISIILGIGIALYLSHTISAQLKAMISNAKEMAEGNLVVPTLAHGKIDDFNYLSDALNNTRNKLGDLVSRITCSSNSLYEHSGNLKSLITQSQLAIEAQQQETDMIATAMNEMGATVKEVAQNTTEAAKSAEEADSATATGHKVVGETVESINSLANAIEHAANTINQLNEETNAVDTILVVISGIADQTNLLALNAAIEAARAGEQGRGFAVVADEVRTLAARTQESTGEIRIMLDRLKNGATNAVEVMSEGHTQAQKSVEKANVARETLQSIAATVNAIKDMNTQIAIAAEEQSAVTDEMNHNITTINTSSHMLVEQSKDSLVSANEMAGMASQLAEGVAQFNIDKHNLNRENLYTITP
ncbi:MAG: methyl-accepting chemotaxis protein [Candidatus Endobugula sp.]|jgi:methyl-accepting chemotaxis protein